MLNGNGDATGLEWIREAGLLTTPIAITNTHSVGVVRDALIAAERERLPDDAVYWCMPVVMETYDGLLNDIWGQHVTPAQVREAQQAAESGPVQEGPVGGGTGMICHEFKGGIGTASRRLADDQGAGPSASWSRPTMASGASCGSTAIRLGVSWVTCRRPSPRPRRAPRVWVRSWW